MQEPSRSEPGCSWGTFRRVLQKSYSYCSVPSLAADAFLVFCRKLFLSMVTVHLKVGYVLCRDGGLESCLDVGG